MKCKNCNNTIEITLFGLKGFCSDDCKKAYRKAYMADLMKRKRSVSNRGGYLSINTQNVSSGKSHEKPIYKGQNGGLGLSEDNFGSYGGKQWYKIAKTHCCNFEVREKEGFCTTTAEPYHTFQVKCSECSLGTALMSKKGIK